MPLKVKLRTLPANVAPVGRSVADRFTSSALTVAPDGMLKPPKSILIPPVKVMGVSLTIVTTVPSIGVVSELLCSPPPGVEVEGEVGVVSEEGVVSEAGVVSGVDVAETPEASCSILLIFSRLTPALFAVSTTSVLICSVSVFAASTVFCTCSIV